MVVKGNCVLQMFLCVFDCSLKIFRCREVSYSHFVFKRKETSIEFRGVIPQNIYFFAQLQVAFVLHADMKVNISHYDNSLPMVHLNLNFWFNIIITFVIRPCQKCSKKCMNSHHVHFHTYMQLSFSEVCIIQWQNIYY